MLLAKLEQSYRVALKNISVLQEIMVRKKKLQNIIFYNDNDVYFKEGIKIWKLIRSTLRKLEEYEKRKCWKKEELKVNMGRYKLFIILSYFNSIGRGIN